MKKVLAISGGVDSVVMLDVLASHDIIVAHFNHGMRSNAVEDTQFVERLADEYMVEYRAETGELGPKASEAEAREKRYEFLQKIATEVHGEVYTAHHLDDLLETIIINLTRGTGWRGLAVLDKPGVKRPLLETEYFYEPLDKLAILEYAAKRGLRFREDQSNSSDEYLRNRIRHQMNFETMSFEKKLEIYELWQQQKALKREIGRTVTSLLPSLLPSGESEWLRKWFQELDADELDRSVAREILRAGLLRAGIKATRPQIEGFRQAIINYAPGKYFNLPGDRLVKIEREKFVL